MRNLKVKSFKAFITENLVFNQSKEDSKYQAGDEVIYLYKDKDLDDWMGLSEEERKNPKEKPASNVVGIKKIEKIDGANMIFLDKDGKEFSKRKSDVIKKL
jgi:hypothetical protein